MFHLCPMQLELRLFHLCPMQLELRLPTFDTPGHLSLCVFAVPGKWGCNAGFQSFTLTSSVTRSSASHALSSAEAVLDKLFSPLAIG
jgi:hypothetical protein